MKNFQQRGHEPDFRRFRHDATCLRGKRMRLTYGEGLPQMSRAGAVDVICIDDTPNVLHDLRVHPIGRPEVVLRVDFRQLELHPDQP